MGIGGVSQPLTSFQQAELSVKNNPGARVGLFSKRNPGGFEGFFTFFDDTSSTPTQRPGRHAATRA